MNELTMSLKSRSRLPLYEQIYSYIKTDIQQGRIAYGEKLPSTRALSKHLEVSRSTVELAYEQLLSEGYIESKPYKGFFVAQTEELYHLDALKKGFVDDLCVLYVFRCAVYYYAEHEQHDPQKLKWWYWKNREYPENQ